MGSHVFSLYFTCIVCDCFYSSFIQCLWERKQCDGSFNVLYFNLACLFCWILDIVSKILLINLGIVFLLLLISPVLSYYCKSFVCIFHSFFILYRYFIYYLRQTRNGEWWTIQLCVCFSLRQSGTRCIVFQTISFNLFLFSDLCSSFLQET